MTSHLPAFTVDKEGLARLWSRKGKAWAVTELLQNAWDEDGVTRCEATLTWAGGKAELTVTDDSPDGWADLTHAYKLFAPSYKVRHADKRGRFNVGEKLVVAIAERAKVVSTTGAVEWEGDLRNHLAERTTTGSVFTATLPMTKAEFTDACKVVGMLLPPAGLETVFNGKVLEAREPEHEFECGLHTEFAGDDGQLRRTWRKTQVRLYARQEKKAWLYELGIPVVEIECGWDVDVGQKVPLNIDRDNVRPSFVRELYREVLNNTTDLLSKEQAREGWVTKALEDPKVTAEAVQVAVTQRFGEKRVSYDPSDPEANKLAMSQDYTVVHGPMLPKKAWENVRQHEAVRPAGQVTPSPKPYQEGQEKQRATLPEEDWTPGMHAHVAFAKTLAERLMGAHVNVEIVNDGACMNFSATYGRSVLSNAGELEYNLRTLGRRYFENDPIREEHVSLLIHEFGHHYSRDHLSGDYHKALCDLGARAARLALDDPDLWVGAIEVSHA